MGNYKRQHTITKAYLRGFAAAETPNTLWRYDKHDGSCEAKSVDNATVKFHAYSFREQDGEWNHEAEKLLSEVEDLALPLLPRLSSGQVLSDMERDQVALFVAVMFRRPSALLEYFQEKFLGAANDPANKRALLDGLMPELREQFSKEEIQSAWHALEAGEFDVGADAAKAMQIQQWFRAAPRHAQFIANLHWQIWKAAGGCSFLTSDAPVYIRSEGRYEKNEFVAIGEVSKRAELFFPIDKRSLLIAKHRPCKEVQRASAARVRELNALTTRMAQRYVFGSIDSISVRDIVEQNRQFVPPMPDFAELLKAYVARAKHQNPS